MFDLVQEFAIIDLAWTRVDQNNIPKNRKRCKKRYLPKVYLSEECLVEGKIIECKCPMCHETKMIIKNGKHGLFLGCSKYPECDGSRSVGNEKKNFTGGVHKVDFMADNGTYDFSTYSTVEYTTSMYNDTTNFNTINIDHINKYKNLCFKYMNEDITNNMFNNE